MIKKILLVLPASENDSLISARYRFRKLRQTELVPPISIATIAALTPQEIEVILWDENIQGRISDDFLTENNFDIVGITGYAIHAQRGIEIAKVAQRSSLFVVGGGSEITRNPDNFKPYFDVLFIGEGELTWPKFIVDFNSGESRSIYKSEKKPDLDEAVKPEWHNLKDFLKNSYLMGVVESTRGCPFSCNFCNVWQVFGNNVRTKPVETVIDEIKTFSDLGINSIKFASDNFYGDPQYAKKLLKRLIEIKSDYKEQNSYFAQISINIANDDNLLELISEANFSGLFIGIESPSHETLKASNKLQNLKGNLIENCKKIQSYGMPIEGSLIVGFDSDQKDIFDLHYDFIQEASITIPRIHFLRAVAGTEFWNIYQKDNRVVDIERLFKGKDQNNATGFVSNLVPMNMTRTELYKGYIDLLARLSCWDNLLKRLIGFIENLQVVKTKFSENISLADSIPEQLETVLNEIDDANIKKTILRIVSFTMHNAPHMMKIVITTIIRYDNEVNNFFPITKRVIMQLIEIEESINIEDYLT